MCTLSQSHPKVDFKNQLSSHREVIDFLDRSIFRYVIDRLRVVESISEIKKKAGLEVFDPNREKDQDQKLRELLKDMDEEELLPLITPILDMIKSVSRDYQNRLIGDHVAMEKGPFYCRRCDINTSGSVSVSYPNKMECPLCKMLLWEPRRVRK